MKKIFMEKGAHFTTEKLFFKMTSSLLVERAKNLVVKRAEGLFGGQTEQD
jgi:hypothetical protein